MSNKLIIESSPTATRTITITGPSDVLAGIAKIIDDEIEWDETDYGDELEALFEALNG